MHLASLALLLVLATTACGHDPPFTCGTCGAQSRRNEVAALNRQRLLARSCTDADQRPECKPQRHNIAAQILHRWRKNAGLFGRGAASNATYKANHPFPHLHFDHVLPPSVLHQVHEDFPDNATHRHTSVSSRTDGVGGYLKYSTSNETHMGPAVQGVIAAMKSPSFLTFLERLTGIGPLMADPTNDGGGIHQIGRGGSLQIHADFNMQSQMFHRRVNTFVYLNPEWNSDAWNGDLELWDRDMRTCEARIAPLDNRLVVFSTTDFSYHGHADALACPKWRSRRSIAMYYYTAERPLHEVLNRDGRPVVHSTLYQARRCASCTRRSCRGEGARRAT